MDLPLLACVIAAVFAALALRAVWFVAFPRRSELARWALCRVDEERLGFHLGCVRRAFAVEVLSWSSLSALFFLLALALR